MATIPLENLQVGETVALTIKTKTKKTGADKNPSSATMAVWDPDLEVEGTATGGSTTTLVDTIVLTQADDYFNGIPAEIYDASDDGKAYQVEITDFDQGTNTITFGALPITVVAGDTYKILGTPVLTQAAATVANGNECSRQVTPSDATARPRTLHGKLVATFSATDIAVCDFSVEVAGAAAEQPTLN